MGHLKEKLIVPCPVNYHDCKQKIQCRTGFQWTVKVRVASFLLHLFLCSGKFILTLSKIWWPLYFTAVWTSRPVMAGPEGFLKDHGSTDPCQDWILSLLYRFSEKVTYGLPSHKALPTAFFSFLNIHITALIFNLISFLWMLFCRLMKIFYLLLELVS